MLANTSYCLKFLKSRHFSSLRYQQTNLTGFDTQVFVEFETLVPMTHTQYAPPAPPWATGDPLGRNVPDALGFYLGHLVQVESPLPTFKTALFLDIALTQTLDALGEYYRLYQFCVDSQLPREIWHRCGNLATLHLSYEQCSNRPHTATPAVWDAWLRAVGPFTT